MTAGRFRAIVLLLSGVLVFWLARRDPSGNGALYAVGVVLLVLGVLRFVRELRRT